MSLPSLGLQLVYSHFAWGMVMAACGVGLLARRRPFPGGLATAWLVLAFVVCALPGAASPAYWLGLAFQQPSALLVGCCAVSIWRKAQGEPTRPVLPVSLAATLFAVGTLLYADSLGWLHLGLYLRGFGHEAALAGLLVGTGAVLAAGFGRHRGVAFAALLSVALFALSRLPTGNVWDAVLDPLLWLWALVSLLRRAAPRRHLHGHVQQTP